MQTWKYHTLAGSRSPNVEISYVGKHSMNGQSLYASVYSWCKLLIAFQVKTEGQFMMTLFVEYLMFSYYLLIQGNYMSYHEIIKVRYL